MTDTPGARPSLPPRFEHAGRQARRPAGTQARRHAGRQAGRPTDRPTDQPPGLLHCSMTPGTQAGRQAGRPTDHEPTDRPTGSSLHVVSLQIAVCSLPCGLAVLPPIAQIARLHMPEKSRPRQPAVTQAPLLHIPTIEVIKDLYFTMQYMQLSKSPYGTPPLFPLQSLAHNCNDSRPRKYILIFVLQALAKCVKWIPQHTIN